MRKIIVTFGLISGAISSLMMIALVTFGGRIGFDRGAIIGNTSIVLSFLMVFFGIRTYRDNIGNGQITFSKAFAVGLSITLISCIVYVVTWELIYYNFLPGSGTHMALIWFRSSPPRARARQPSRKNFSRSENTKSCTKTRSSTQRSRSFIPSRLDSSSRCSPRWS
jgi:hypothetical protein